MEALEAAPGDDPCGSTLALTLAHSDNLPSFGFTLTRSKVEPYPKVDVVEWGSAAAAGGLVEGDVVLEAEGRPLLGCSLECVLRVIGGAAHALHLTVWRPPHYHPDLDLAKTLVKVAQLLTCPVCFREVALQPRQCRNGHLMCANCALRSPKSCCPLCRVFLGRPANNRLALPGARCLLAEKMVAVMRTEGDHPLKRITTNDENKSQEQPQNRDENCSTLRSSGGAGEENSAKAPGKLHLVARLVRALR